MRRTSPVLAWVLAMSVLAASCGGGNSSGGPFNFAPGIGSGNNGGTGIGANTVALVVDGGPAASGGTVNSLFTTVRICAPGSTSECQTIDHVQVDTASTGFRVIASTLGYGVTTAQLPRANDGNGDPVDECVQYADGYSWGSVRTADLIIGSKTAAAIPIQVIGDVQASPVPASCITGPPQNTVQALGANAILGIGNFLTDCGIACETSAIPGTYYGCPASAICQAIAVPLTQQLQNPVSLFATDNNGVIVSLPSVASPSKTVSGTLIFGIGTQADNAAGNKQIYTLDPNHATLSTLYKGTRFGSSFLDAGSSGYFFTDPTIPICADQAAFYCPASPLMQIATLQGTNGVMADIPFTVDNADADFATNAAALPNLAGPTSSTATDSFDWGLPFFYGRSVYIAFEAGSPAGVPGPWVGF